MHYKLLADRVKYFKEDKKKVRAMCRTVEELLKEDKIDAARKLLADGTLTFE